MNYFLEMNIIGILLFTNRTFCALDFLILKLITDCTQPQIVIITQRLSVSVHNKRENRFCLHLVFRAWELTTLLVSSQHTCLPNCGEFGIYMAVDRLLKVRVFASELYHLWRSFNCRPSALMPSPWTRALEC